jgi:murein DD-endopeptidase MepM/ murein hydrolase activator NlpD
LQRWDRYRGPNAAIAATAAIVLAAAALLLVPGVRAADGAAVQRASVSPKQSFADSADGVRIEFKIGGTAPADVTIAITRSGQEVRRIEVAGVQPGVERTVKWDGLTNAGRLVPDGTYRLVVGIDGGLSKEAGKVTLRRYFFPVRGPHGTRGPVGEFNAPRNGGRRHKGFDVTGRCGTPLAAAVSGTVVERAYDRRLDGNFVVIKQVGAPRQYLYAHMIHPSRYHQGDFVHVGQIVGRIGRTGNARTVGCHLHFEIHVHGRPIDPQPSLRAWDRYS